MLGEKDYVFWDCDKNISTSILWKNNLEKFIENSLAIRSLKEDIQTLAMDFMPGNFHTSIDILKLGIGIPSTSIRESTKTIYKTWTWLNFQWSHQQSTTQELLVVWVASS